jgi:hypothetical protein
MLLPSPMLCPSLHPEWDRTANVLQDSQFPADTASRQSITQFITNLLQGCVDTPLLWDLSPSSTFPLGDKLGHYLSVEKRVIIHTTTAGQWAPQRRHIRVAAFMTSRQSTEA